ALLGWSYDDKTEFMTRDELIERFSLARVNAAPASWNYDKLDHFNGYYIRQLAVDDLTDRLLPFLAAAGFQVDRARLLRITPLIQERLNTLAAVIDWVDFFFVEDLADYDPAELVPKKTDASLARTVLERAYQVLQQTSFTHEALETALRTEAEALGVKTGQMFQPIRVAVCGKMVAPPLFETLEILGQATSLKRLRQAIAKLQ
ncbi:MAG: glutamate--tRNA ligase, partial [Chloroflexota bacterium]